jgi:hypothetical protein
MHATRKARAGLTTTAMLAMAAVMGATACGDDPFAFEWSDAPDTVLLYSLARPELNLVSAYNFFQGFPVQVELANATGTWDLAVDTRAGQIVILPPGGLGVVSEAAIAPIPSVSIADVTEAPLDTLLYVDDEAIPVEMGTVYIVKTNRAPGSFGRSCVYYAKLEAVDIDPVGGTFTFREVTNPVCNDRDLVPPN